MKAKVKRPINVLGRADKLHNSKIPIAFLYFSLSYSISTISRYLYNQSGTWIDFQSQKCFRLAKLHEFKSFYFKGYSMENDVDENGKICV